MSIQSFEKNNSLKKKIATPVQLVLRRIHLQIYWFIGITAVGAVTFFAADNYICQVDLKSRINLNQTILESIGQNLHSALTNPGELFHNVFLSTKKVTFYNLIANNKESISRDFELLTNSYRGVIQQLRVLNKTGKEELRVNFQEGKAVPVAEFDMQDKSQRDYFKKAQQLEKDQLLISEIDLNREKGKIAEPRQTTVRFIAKGFDEKGNFRGFFVANFRVPELDKLINGFTNHDESKIRIWNEDRQIIGSNEPGQLHKIFGTKENIPFYNSDGEVLPKSDVVSVRLPIKIKEHMYTMELYTEIKNIMGQGESKNIPLHLALMAMGISGLVVVTANWRSTAKRSEQLQQLNEDLQRETSAVLLLQKIAISCNESPTVEGALQTCIDLICDYTGWPVGHIYLRAKDNPNKLLPTDIWSISNHQEFKVFQKVTEETSLYSGEGLPGRVLYSGKPDWIIDVTKDSNFPRAKLAKNIGVKAGFAFPLLSGTNVVGVIEFFSSYTADPNDNLLKLMENIGIQIGRIVEHKEAEEKLQETKWQLEAAYNEVKVEQAGLTASDRLVDFGTMAAGKKLKKGTEDKKVRYPDALIYIVEDEQVIRTVIKKMLFRVGYKNIKVFANGRLALEALNEAVKEGDSLPDLILSDIRMHELDGLSLCRKAFKLEITRQTSFVMLTEDRSRESMKPFAEFGDFVVGSISKPFSVNNLKRCLSSALKNHFSKKTKTI